MNDDVKRRHQDGDKITLDNIDFMVKNRASVAGKRRQMNEKEETERKLLGQS